MEHAIHIPIELSLGFIGFVLTASVVISLIFPKQTGEATPLVEVHSSTDSSD